MGEVRKVFDAYMSPGSVTEKLHFFVAEYDPESRVGEGGGVADEGEDIEVLEIPIEEALRMMDDGRIADGKTIMLLQHARLHLFPDPGVLALGAPRGRAGMSTVRAVPCGITLIGLLAGSVRASPEDNWPQWRGPRFDGSAQARDLPVQWSQTDNVAWRTRLPSWSAATPIVWGDIVFVTSAQEGFTELSAEGRGPAPSARARPTRSSCSPSAARTAPSGGSGRSGPGTSSSASRTRPRRPPSPTGGTCGS